MVEYSCWQSCWQGPHGSKNDPLPGGKGAGPGSKNAGNMSASQEMSKSQPTAQETRPRGAARFLGHSGVLLAVTMLACEGLSATWRRMYAPLRTNAPDTCCEDVELERGAVSMPYVLVPSSVLPWDDKA